MVTAAMKLKDACSLEEKAMTNLDSILKNRDISLPTKVHLVKAMGFPVSRVFASGGQSIGASASTQVLSKSIQG